MKKNLLVIASYPPKNNTHHKSVVGGASYSKNTLLYLYKAIKKQGNKLAVTVLAEEQGKRDCYSDNGITVKRMWKRNSLLSFPKMFIEIIRNHKQTKDILLEFEFAMFGEKLALLPLPLFVLFLRLFGKNVTFVFHQVVTDLSELNGHLNIKKSGIKTSILNTCMQSLYIILTALSSKVIVFDEILRGRLDYSGLAKKVAVIPHGVEDFKNIPSQKRARKLLSLPGDTFVLLAFGYLAWYKGTDWIADMYAGLSPEVRKRTTLIIAGGPNPNHMNKGFYKTYIANLDKQCKKYNILLTDFVPEKDIPLYFQASDLVLFPYRVHMSASGPLSLALSFKKPFMIANKLKSIFRTHDMRRALEEKGLTPQDFSFSDTKSLEKQLTSLQINNRRLQKLSAYSQTMKRKRIWDTIGAEYASVLFSAPKLQKSGATIMSQPAYEISSHS